MAGELNLLL